MFHNIFERRVAIEACFNRETLSNQADSFAKFVYSRPSKTTPTRNKLW